MVREIKFDNLDECCVCNSTKLEILLDLPRLPHIGIYLNPNDDQSAYPPIDNTLMYCHSCGHIQIGRAIDPSFLYTSDFQHKTSESSSAKQANNFLFKFTKEILKARPPELVAEIGCNDTFFLSKFVDNYKSTVIGVDPILKGKEDLFNICEYFFIITVAILVCCLIAGVVKIVTIDLLNFSPTLPVR